MDADQNSVAEALREIARELRLIREALESQYEEEEEDEDEDYDEEDEEEE
jgi:hypothetical protein